MEDQRAAVAAEPQAPVLAGHRPNRRVAVSPGVAFTLKTTRA
jgi:hypothetical protein